MYTYCWEIVASIKCIRVLKSFSENKVQGMKKMTAWIDVIYIWKTLWEAHYDVGKNNPKNIPISAREIHCESKFNGRHTIVGSALDLDQNLSR